MNIEGSKLLVTRQGLFFGYSSNSRCRSSACRLVLGPILPLAISAAVVHFMTSATPVGWESSVSIVPIVVNNGSEEGAIKINETSKKYLNNCFWSEASVWHWAQILLGLPSLTLGVGLSTSFALIRSADFSASYLFFPAHHKEPEGKKGQKIRI